MSVFNCIAVDHTNVASTLHEPASRQAEIHVTLLASQDITSMFWVDETKATKTSSVYHIHWDREETSLAH